MSEIKEYKINIIDNEHIEGVDVEQNVQIADLFEKAVAGNYKYYRTIGVKKPIGNGEYGRKIYSCDETAKKGLYANTTIEKSPDLWFENPHYVAVEFDMITETTIEETEIDLVEPVEVETLEPKQVVEEKVETEEVIIIDGNDTEKMAMFDTITNLSEQVTKLSAENEELKKANASLSDKVVELINETNTAKNEIELVTAKANAYDSLQTALAVLKSFLA